jgi:hypothetical protein
MINRKFISGANGKSKFLLRIRADSLHQNNWPVGNLYKTIYFGKIYFLI